MPSPKLSQPEFLQQEISSVPFSISFPQSTAPSSRPSIKRTADKGLQDDPQKSRGPLSASLKAVRREFRRNLDMKWTETKL